MIVQGASGVLTPSGAPPSRTGIALAQDAINWRHLQELCFGILQAAGFSSIPSLETIPFDDLGLDGVRQHPPGAVAEDLFRSYPMEP